MATNTMVSTKVSTKVGAALIGAAAIAAAVVLTTTTAPAQPNLSFNGAPTYTAGAAPSVSFSWKNAGAAPASWTAGQHQVWFRFFDAAGNITGPVCSPALSAVATMTAGQAAAYSSTTDATCGPWLATRPANAASLGVMLDPDKAVAESNETDNFVTVNLPPAPPTGQPNITFKASPGPTTLTAPLTFSFTNAGTVAATFPAGSKILTMYYVDAKGVVVTSPACDYKLSTALTMAPGNVVAYDSSKDANCTAWYANRPSTGLAVQVLFNSGNAVAESNTTDNALTVNVPHESGQANITFKASPSPTTLTAPLTFSFTNAGTASAVFPAGSKIISMYYVAPPGKVVTTPACDYKLTTELKVAPGAVVAYDSSKDANCTAWYMNRPVGTIAIQVLFNPNATVAESNTTDNSLTVSVPVKK